MNIRVTIKKSQLEKLMKEIEKGKNFSLAVKIEEKEQEGIIRIRDLEIDLFTDRISFAGKQVSLSIKQMRILKILIKKRGEIVSREEFKEEIWHDTVVSIRALDAHVARIRKILPKGAIETIRIVGYRLDY